MSSVVTRSLGAALIWVTLIPASAFAAPQPLAPQGRRAGRPTPAIAAVLAEFNRYPLVALGEWHDSVPFHVFLRELIADPLFPTKVNDIVVECGNARFQGLADRYVDGEDVSTSELQSIWRETTQLLVFDSPLYEQIFTAVRTLNATLPAGQRVRVLLGDPPIDWAAIKVPSDYEPFAARDPDTAGVIGREVLAKKRRALLLFGGAHLTKADPYAAYRSTPSRPTITQLIEAQWPHTVFVFGTLVGSNRHAALAAWQPGQALILRGNEVGKRSLKELGVEKVTLLNRVDGKQVLKEVLPEQLPSIDTMYDGLIWVARTNQRWRACPDSYDDAYLAKVKARAQILDAFFGLDFFVKDVDELAASRRKL